MEDDFGIPSSTNADVCACRRHDVGKDERGERAPSQQGSDVQIVDPVPHFGRGKNKDDGRTLADAAPTTQY
jgi:hypothetical protein